MDPQTKTTECWILARVPSLPLWLSQPATGRRLRAWSSRIIYLPVGARLSAEDTVQAGLKPRFIFICGAFPSEAVRDLGSPQQPLFDTNEELND